MTRQDSPLSRPPYSPARERELSERELEIIGLVAEGLTNQEIATSLTISKRTVDNHVSNIFTKTGAKNRVALLNWAMDHGKVCRDGFNCCALESSHDSGHPA
ncbi:MAG: helix-turn-helix transcriptional regulator [Chitinophagaceae bacterium]|jgi:DNA-binding NarL/FixJ family response regulator|nr:helix-turn-helix transcriptional regulator [Chitinophagaceae bacterium]